MGWIKRNLLFVVIGLVALAALGGAGFFIYQSFSNNSEKAQKLNELYDALGNLNKEQPQPGATNTAVAKEQEQQLRVWISQAASHFRPIPPIPAGEVTSMTFGTALNNVINELTQEAKENSVTLPPKYCFSFQVQNGLLTISSGLGPLAQQLGEVKTIAQIMFAAGVNNLDSIQRVKVSEDDVTKGLESDYTDKLPITNHLAILTPYIVTFRCFTPELAKVIAGFANSTNPFIVESVSVQPASTESTANGLTPGNPNMYGQPYGQPYGQQYGQPYGQPYTQPARRFNGGGRMGGPGMMTYAQPQPQPFPAQPAGKGGLQTVIKEQLLRVTLEVDVVKLLLKS